MLTKLFKHEFKATGRIFLPLMAMLVGVSLLTKLFTCIPISNTFTEIIGLLMQTLCYIMIVAALAACLIICVKRFKSNLTGDEGYLMFTLPVTATQHVAVKLLTSLVWFVFSAIAAIAAAFILNYYNGIFVEIGNWLSNLYAALTRALAMPVWLYIVIFIVAAIVIIDFNFLSFFAAVAIGQLSNAHKTAVSFLAYFGIYAAMQTINVVALTLYMKLSDNFGTVVNSINEIELPMFQLILVFSVIYLICSVLLYILTSALLSKKLNLE